MYKEKLRTNFFRSTNISQETYFKRQFLNTKALREADALVEELRKRLRNLGVSETSAHGKVVWDAYTLPVIRKIVIAGAFYPNYSIRGAQGGQVDYKDAVKMLSGKDPRTSVYLQGMPVNQPGVLYKKEIKIALKDCGIVKDVTFDGSSKVFVEFERGRFHDVHGNISLAVYRAVRTRQLRLPVVINCLPVDRAHALVKKLGIETSRLLVMSEKSESNQRSYLPTIETQIIEFAPCHVQDPNRFWVHSGVESELHWVQTSLNSPGNVHFPSEEVRIGRVYAVPYPVNEQLLYRARVCRISDDKTTAMVQYLDYGNIEDAVPLKFIYEISPILLERDGMVSFPPLALECTLTNIALNPITNPKGTWSEDVRKLFDSILKSAPKWYGEVYSVVDGIVSLIVKDNQSSINDFLIKKKYAVFVNEDCRSEEDHQYRLEAMDYAYEKDDDKYKFLQPKLNFKFDMSDPLIDESERRTQKITLRGPISPLEMKVYGCTYITAGKEVTVDLESVNAALLDNDPDDPHERLMISANVSQNPAGTRLKLLHTTLMPNIHGLAALLSLIFAPTIELRRSPDKSFFSGALCGLGCDDKTSEPIFPEHDMEIVFDCAIGLPDLVKINKLRYWMNIPLESDGTENCKASAYEVLNSQQKVKEFLLDLLHHPWLPQEVSLCQQPYQWKTYDDEDLLDPGLRELSGVYKPHWGLKLNDWDS